MPKRLQLRRTTGWRKPEGAVIVSRPTIWGNPFTIDEALAVGIAKKRVARFVVDCYDNWLRGDRQHWMGPESDAAAALILARLPELRGRDLLCWCPPGCPCHADVLLEMANA